MARVWRGGDGNGILNRQTILRRYAPFSFLLRWQKWTNSIPCGLIADQAKFVSSQWSGVAKHLSIKDTLLSEAAWS